MSTEVSLDTKVAFLRDPASYRPSLKGVQSIETHMAWVFLAGAAAYKLKKPVKFEFLDFSTLSLRLTSLYRSVRACVRAVLAAGHLDDAHADVEKWSKRANSYLDLAKSYLPGMEA